MRRPALALALALASSAIAPTARAGNDDGVLLGNEAAMTGGSGSALVSDGSATWYNPAGIAAVDRDTLDLSGSATMLRIADTPALLQSSTGEYANGGYYEFLGIPSAVTLVRRLDCITALGLGIFVPQLTSHTDRVGLAETFPGPMGNVTTNWQLTNQEASSTYYGGVTLGISLLPNFRVGFTFFGTYRQFALTSQFFGAAVDEFGAAIAGFGTSGLASLQSVSLELAGGIQWEIVPGLHLGFSARTPGLLVGSQYRVAGSSFGASPAAGITFSTSDEGALRPQLAVVTPARFRFAIAYRWAQGWIGIDGDFQHVLSSPEVGVDRDWTGGVRIGGRYQVDPNVSLGAGLFTDLDATRVIDGYGDTRIDFFGGSFGIELHNPHRLGEGENASDIVFVNTFALRYAVGVGQIGGLRFDAQSTDAAVSVVAVDTTIHEISLHLGSALYF